VKELLSQRGIGFCERDVALDAVALTELEQLGFLTAPVTLIDGEAVIGFDPDRLDSLLDGDKASDDS
jgi:hypothetical protein